MIEFVLEIFVNNNYHISNKKVNNSEQILLASGKLVSYYLVYATKHLSTHFIIITSFVLKQIPFLFELSN